MTSCVAKCNNFGFSNVCTNCRIKYSGAFDADALSNNLPINRYIDGLAIRGTLVIAGNNLKELDFTSLKEEQIEEYTQMFSLDREEELEL